MPANLANQFISEIHHLSCSALPESVVHQAKIRLLDYLGATFAGARMLGQKGEMLLSYLGHTDDATVIGYNQKSSVEMAALINGLSSHIAELDDGARFGMIHPGSPVFSALLPVAEKENIKGIQFIKGIVAGYEAEIRIACAIQPSHYKLGYHPTSTCGTIGAALGIAAMLEFDEVQMKNALSSAAISAAGTLKVIEDGTELKPLNVGRAAMNAIVAAYMAKADFKGVNDVFSGNTGFLSMMTEEYDETKLFKDNLFIFAIEQAYIKPYAACRHAHPAIEAGIKIRSEAEFKIDSIKEIKIITYRGVLGKHDHIEITGSPSAKMSIPYGLAVALVTGEAGIDQFNEAHVSDPEILALTKKVVVSADDEISALVPQQRAAIVEIQMNDGTCRSERVDFPKGEPENPLSNVELEEKFTCLASYGHKQKDDVTRIIDLIGNLETEFPSLLQML